jgi:HPt (histidine-containing phosphotransfer) domain-containing protein
VSEPPLIDCDVVAQLARLLPPDRLEAFLVKCRTDAGQRAAALRALSAAADIPGIRGHAHNLISTAGTIGARRAQSLASTLQSACDNGESIAACALAGVLAQTLLETWSAMDEAFPPQARH